MNKKDILKVVGGFSGGIAIGFVVGFYRARKNAEKAWAEIAAAEIQQVKEHYRLLRKEDVILDDPGISEESEAEELSLTQYAEVLSDMGYSGDPADITKMFDQGVSVEEALRKTEITPEEDVEPEVVKIFEKLKETPIPEEEYDPEYEEYNANRNPDEPYIISVSDYMSKAVSSRYTLTYYEDDDVLVDDRSKVVPDVVRVVGEDALVNFGKFSQDKNIVYVRNERNDVDFEIIRNPGSYEEEVLGVTSKPIIGKMQEDD